MHNSSSFLFLVGVAGEIISAIITAAALPDFGRAILALDNALYWASGYLKISSWAFVELSASTATVELPTSPATVESLASTADDVVTFFTSFSTSFSAHNSYDHTPSLFVYFGLST